MFELNTSQETNFQAHARQIEIKLFSLLQREILGFPEELGRTIRFCA